MAKMGKYDFPEVDLDVALKHMTIFVDKYKAKEMSRETFIANILEMSEKSSWAKQVLASLGRYGLVELSQGQVKITNIAEDAIKGTADDQKNAKSKAVLSVALFADLFAKYGTKADQNQVLVFLKEEGGAGSIEANKGALMVTKIYMSNAKYIITAEGTKDEGKSQQGRSDNKVETAPDLPQGFIAMVVTPFGTMKIDSIEKIDLLHDTLDNFVKYYQTPSQKTQSDEKKEEQK
jgi:Pyruvate/2-oxoacid:ferredoxin oxidoreductase gamma subunit